MKRLFSRSALLVGLTIALFAVLAFVRGGWASDETRIQWARSVGGGMYVLDRLEVLTCMPVCVFSYERHRDRLTPRIEREAGFHLAHSASEPISAAMFALSSPSVWHRLGFVIEVKDETSRSAYDHGSSGRWHGVLALPTWFIAVMGIAIAARPTWSLWRERRARARHGQGRCPACGYDLRGALHERCPECGEVADAAVVRT